MIKDKKTTGGNTGYTSGGFQSNLQAPGSLARAVTVDNESATEPARCIPSTLAAKRSNFQSVQLC
jgi:hypothetical protein